MSIAFCVFVSIDICMFMVICGNNLYPYMCLYTPYIYTCLHVCVCIHIYVYVYVYMYMYMYIYICICVCICSF